MLLLISITMLLMALTAFWLERAWLFPPAIYALYWCVIVLSSIVVPYEGYSLSLQSLLVFLVGCIGFWIGGYSAVGCLGGKAKSNSISHQRKDFMQKCILIYGIFLLSLSPLLVYNIRHAADFLGVEHFAVAARIAFGEADRVGIPRYFQSFASVGSITCYIAAWLFDSSTRAKFTLAISLIAVLFMNVLTFSRTPIYMQVIGVLVIMLFRRTISAKVVLVSVALMVFLGLAIGVVLGKGPDFGSIDGPVYAILGSITMYVAGGPLGFAQVMNDPSSVGESGLSLRFFSQPFQSIGVNIELPSNVLDYVSPVLGNIYTIYYAYWLDWGWVGIICMSFAAGFLSTVAYIFARRQNPIAGVALGRLTGAVFYTTIGDELFGSAVPWVLVVVITWFLWRCPIGWVQSNFFHKLLVAFRVHRERIP